VKVTQDKIEARQAYLTIEMEPAEVEDGLNKAYSRLVKKANIPGFRKGKVPRPILEQYIGKEALLEDAVEHMAPEVFEKAAKEKDLKPIARPEVEIEKIEPVTYKMVVPLEPVIKVGDYHLIKLTPESIELKEEDINNSIEQLRHEHAIWETVDRQVNGRDKIVLDIESNVGDQPYINQQDAEYEVIKDSEFPMKGFAEELIGMKKGETKEFKLSFPQDYGRQELAGKETSFKVTVKEIKQEKLLEVNDEFAQKVNPEYKTVDDLKKKVADDLKNAAEVKAKQDFQQKILDTLVESSEIEYPPILEEDELNNLINSQMRRWQIDEKGLDQYLQSINKTPEEFRNELRPSAIRSLRQSLVITEVARNENIKVEESDLRADLNNMTKSIPEQSREQFLRLFNSPQAQTSMAAAIATRKTIAKLEEIVQSSTGTAEKVENQEPTQTENGEKEADK